MFTGLIQDIGKVKTIGRMRDDMRLTVAPTFELTGCRTGDSICVDGVCLTVTDVSRDVFRMDVSGETISRSTLSLLRQGDEVNLEMALRLTDRLGGHLVSGHVDGTGRILKKEKQQRSWLIGIGVNERISRYTIEKGSVAVDGISLTINQCKEMYFEVNIIPQTGNLTTIFKKKIGDLVNVETDLIGKYIEKLFTKGRSTSQDKISSGIDLEMLNKYGFGG